MVMIFAIYEDALTSSRYMDKQNQFFTRVFSSPSLIWKGGAGLLFIGIAIAIVLFPSLTDGISNGTRYAFSALLTVYGLFRIGTFYVEYKSYRHE